MMVKSYVPLIFFKKMKYIKMCFESAYLAGIYKQVIYHFKGYDFSFQEMKKILAKKITAEKKELSAPDFPKIATFFLNKLSVPSF